MALVILSDSDTATLNFWRSNSEHRTSSSEKKCNFRLYSESEASRTIWGIRSDLFSAQNNVARFGWYRVTRDSPKLVLAAITRSNFRPKKPCNFKLALILELVLCIRSFEEAKGVRSDQDIKLNIKGDTVKDQINRSIRYNYRWDWRNRCGPMGLG